MGVLDKLLGKMKGKQTKAPSSKDLIEAMLASAEAAMDRDDYETAVEMLKKVVALEPNTQAQYNLGSLYAQGMGTEQSFLEGAYWFHQAGLSGDEKAEQFCTKCIMDYIHQNLDQKTPKAVFEDMLRLAARLYPEGDAKGFATEKIYGLAIHHLKRDEYAVVAKLLRATAEYGDHGPSQNVLGVLYNAGSGVQKDDQAALYWFDRAAGNGVEAAQKDRDGIFGAFKNNFSAEVFSNTIMALSKRCAAGDADIPMDAGKAAYWREKAQEAAQENG